jgi:hypothetical protein
MEKREVNAPFSGPGQSPDRYNLWYVSAGYIATPYGRILLDPMITSLGLDR